MLLLSKWWARKEVTEGREVEGEGREMKSDEMGIEEEAMLFVLYNTITSLSLQ
jgi:hypothetical protein